MAKRVTVNISLPPRLKSIVDRKVESGGFGTASEYIRHLVREDAHNDASLPAHPAELAAKLKAGIDSGAATPFTKRDWADLRARARARSASKRTRGRSA